MTGLFVLKFFNRSLPLSLPPGVGTLTICATGGENAIALLAYLETTESYHINTRYTTPDLKREVSAQGFFNALHLFNTNGFSDDYYAE